MVWGNSNGYVKITRLGASTRRECSPCNGNGVVRERKTIKVDIPGGVEDGMRLRVTGIENVGPGAAEAMVWGNSNGYVKITRLGASTRRNCSLNSPHYCRPWR
jgi:DnaJ-class molecular chaperone